MKVADLVHHKHVNARLLLGLVNLTNETQQLKKPGTGEVRPARSTVRGRSSHNFFFQPQQQQVHHASVWAVAHEGAQKRMPGLVLKYTEKTTQRLHSPLAVGSIGVIQHNFNYQQWRVLCGAKPQSINPQCMAVAAQHLYNRSGTTWDFQHKRTALQCNILREIRHSSLPLEPAPVKPSIIAHP